MSGIRLVEELRRSHDVAEYYAYSEWARMFQAAADRVEFLESEVERIQAEADEDLDGYEDYMGRLDAQLCRSLKAIGEDASGFPDSIDLTCRILESVPRLKAEVERLTPKPMTVDRAVRLMNEIAYDGARDWEEDEDGHGYVRSKSLREGVDTWNAVAVGRQVEYERNSGA